LISKFDVKIQILLYLLILFAKEKKGKGGANIFLQSWSGW